MMELKESFDLEGRLVRSLPVRLRRPLVAVDEAVVGFVERHGVTVLRVALAAIFLWFGALKVIGRSPVAEVVQATVYFLPGEPTLHLLGCLEIAIGIGFLIPIAPRLTLLLFSIQMLGTFLTLVVLPERSFQGGNPLLLGVLGEFVVKNLVLIAAGLVVGASIRRRSSCRHVPVVHPHHRRSGHSP
jgi:putative oxidoreductase